MQQNEETEELNTEEQSLQSETLEENSPELRELLDVNNHPKSVKGGEKRQLENETETNSMSPLPTAKIMPTLRLNVALASDPATNPDAKEILNIHNIKSEESKTEDDDDEVEFTNHNEDAENVLKAINISKVSLSMQQQQQQHQNLLPKAKENINNVNQLIAKNIDIIQRPNVYMCTPCGIRFSSLSTLEAHQTYYCSHRKDADETPQKSSGTASELNGNEPPTKAIKTGKQYACTQCSYSADKKVSLNRHMRMHQTSPAPSSTTSNGDDTSSQIIVPLIGPSPAQPQIVDRYCSDCDIRFSSTKTYRAHKQHYCSSRHQKYVLIL